MKLSERKKAIFLRGKGCSIKEIARALNVSKSSVSLWVKEIGLTQSQKLDLSMRGQRREIIEKRRVTRIKNELIKRRSIIESAKRDISNITEKELLRTGSLLYWAEGGKTKGIVRFSNGDPRLIEIMMVFFRKICLVPELKFRGYIHIHPHLDSRTAERYWSNISGIPLSQFYKTYNKPNKSSQNKRDSLPHGTFDIYICDSNLLLRITGWIEKIYELIVVK